MPWQIIPIWTDKLPTELERSDSVGEFPVSTAIKYHNVDELKEDLIKLFGETQIMLFLRNVKKITVKSKTDFIAEKIQHQNSNVILLKKNGAIQSKWITKTFEISIDDKIKTILKQDDKTPKKLKEAELTSISFAAAIDIDKEHLKSIENNALIFTYLPTKISFDFPFLVNGDFLTNASREAFHVDRVWNQWLFIQVAIKAVEWISELARNERYKLGITNIIPEKLSANDQIKLAFNQGFDWAIENIAFIPATNGDLLKVKEALIDKTDLHTLLDTQLLATYYNQQYRTNFTEKCIVHTQLIAQSKLSSNLRVKSLEIKEIKNLFSSELFQLSLQLKDNYHLIKFLFKKATAKSQSEYWIENLQAAPFIFNQHGVLTAPDAPLYLPAQNFEVSVEAVSKAFNFINENVLAEVREDKEIYKWLHNDIGITTPTQQNVIEKIIIPNIDNLTDTKNKSIEIVRYLFEAWRRGQLKDEYWQHLSQTKIVTITDNLITASASYLADFYQPKILLEEYFSKSVFASPEYIINKTEIKEWNIFFTKIGVYENIAIICNSNYTSYFEINEKYPKYLEDIYNQYIQKTIYAPYIHQHEFQNFTTATFLKQTSSNHRFAKLFWSYVIPKWNEFYGKKTKYWVWRRDTSFEVQSYFDYFIISEKTLPATTGKCLKASEVIINRDEFKEVADSFLPILDLDIDVPKEIQAILGIRTEISLTEYLSVLENIYNQQYNKDEHPALLKRIGIIYDALSKLSLNHEKDEIREWAKDHLILATDFNFYNPEELYYVDIKNFDSHNIEKFAKLPNYNKRVIELLKLMGVNVISSDNLSFQCSDDLQEGLELQAKLESCLPLIALVSSTKDHKNWEEEFQRLHEILISARIYQAGELFLEFKQGDKEIVKRKQKSWSDSKEFYYTGDWNSPITLYSLTGSLSNLLKIKNSDKELNVLLLESFKSALEWLEEEGYNISLIPDDYLSPETTEQINSNTSISIGQVPTLQDERTESQKLYDLETGIIGEKFVFEELKRILKEKYAATDNDIFATPTGFKVRNVTVIWENIIAESGKPYDFRVSDNGVVSHIDAKATTTTEDSGGSIPFYISPNEWALMTNKSSYYYIARVFNTRTNPYMKLIKLEEGEL